MILTRQTTIPVFILLVLFTSLFISLVSISQMPDKIMGSGDIFILTSSTDKNPLRSNLDIEIAYGLENMSYVEAVSPEIFVFTTLNNLPLTIRGVEFKKLIKLEEGEIVEGSIPYQPNGALIGYRAKELLHVKIGDELTLIGAFESSVAIVNITGVYRSNSPTDDELLVSLPTARRLAGIGENEVSIIRIRSERYDMLEKLMDPRYPKFTAMLNVTSHAYTGDAINVSVLINNLGKEVGTCNLTLSWNNVKKVIQNISIAENKLLSFKIKAPNYPGNYTLEVLVGNDLLNYSARTDVQILPKPIFVDGPQIMLTNRTYKFRVFSLEEKELKNITLEILGHGYEISLKDDSPINVKLPYPGNYTFIFRKYGFKEREMNVSVYREVPFEEVAKIEPLYNGDIIIKKGGSIRINATGDIYYSLDNSSLEKTSRIISLPPYITGFHVFRVSIIDGHSMASENFTLYIPDKYSPKIKNEKNEAYYGEWVNFQLSDQVPIRNITVKYGNLTKYYEINQRLEKNKENYTYNVTLQINSTNEIRITFTDALGNTTWASFKFHVIYQEDILPPEILVKDRIEIWGGNTTRIICRDNVAIANISVFIFGKFFNSSSNFVDIPSLFWINNTPQFMPPGAYNGYIIATDVNNNTNSSYFTIIINNNNEKIPPIIIGPDFYTLGFNSSVKYIACDNSLMMGMWINENGEKIKESYSSSITISVRDLSPGWHNLTVYAQDGYGNVGQKNVAIEVKTTANPKVKLSLSASKITPNTYPILSITLRNGNTGGYYNLTVSVDGNPYYTSWIPLQPYQIKTLYVKLPQMKCGEHVISVGEARVYVSVEEERTSLPIDMILKYTKNLKISGSKDVIYRGFEISEGNIILTFSSLLGITIILVFLGIYYSSVKGMKNRNIGVLRAIGASNRDIARLFWMDVLKYLIPSVIGGIILGYLITVTLNYLGILRAFGHQLIISPTPMFLLSMF